MKIFNWIAGFAMSFAIVGVLAITIVQFVCFDTDWYAKEYAKYDVYQTVEMEGAELGKVTVRMIDYLQGVEENLDIEAVVAGKTREFFNEKEKAHMADVKVIFDNIMFARNVCLVIFLFAGMYYLLAKRAGMKLLDYMPVSFAIIGAIFAVIALIAYIAITFNFTGVFTAFHEFAFTNDLWLLDPSTDMLIRILPEGIFYDTADRIAKYLLILGIGSVVAFPVLYYMKWNYNDIQKQLEKNRAKEDKSKIYVD